jgi:hypothetical protein
MVLSCLEVTTTEIRHQSKSLLVKLELRQRQQIVDLHLSLLDLTRVLTSRQRPRLQRPLHHHLSNTLEFV